MKEGYDKKCYICKKKFCTYAAYEYWTYQRHAGKSRRFFCSYACMRKYDLQRGKPEKMIVVRDTCANFCGDDEEYNCFIHGAFVTCDGCKDYKDLKAKAYEVWRERNEGKPDT